MFRLTAIDGEDGRGVVLKVEGRLVGAWVDEFARVVATEMDGPRPVTLDLTGLSFVDARGVDLLRRTARHGARLVGGSAFVTTLIPQETPCDDTTG